MLITLPSVLAINEVRLRNRICQIAARQFPAEGTLATFTRGRLEGLLFNPSDNSEEVLIIPKRRQVPSNHQRVLCSAAIPSGTTSDLKAGQWLRHPLLAPDTADRAQAIRDVLESWSGAFAYVQEDPAQGIRGLRTPQIGSLHAVQAHWTVADSPATVVMPTGTGKTDTMIAVLVSVRCPKLLVVVPTDALRIQLAEKFLTLGVLKEPGCGVLSESARYPIVGVLEHIPRSVAEVDEILEACQIVVMTSTIAGQCEEVIQDRMARHCPYLFIDEAHHTEAPTWSAFKARFKGRRILQFTATPFREDGKLLDGDIIYKYPLKKAQQEGYFKPIRFEPVVQFNPSRVDEAIASKAIKVLRADAEKRHILMARVDSVERAGKVFQIYRKFSEFNPVQLHTGIRSRREREAIRGQIINGEARIVVCVDMLGEGFDLPELKIAAFHDIRKTLAVTLQLAGRFTGARQDLGDATFIANVADVTVQEELRKLYTRDPDWNILLPELSDKLIGAQVSLQEFLRGFTEFPDEIPLKAVRPAMSTVVYKTRCESWSPGKFREGIPGVSACEQVHHTINERKNTLVVVTAKRVALPWTDVEDLFSWEWELYVVSWSPEQSLLFINGSTNAGNFRALAQAVVGEDAALIRGQEVFRTFAGVNRLRLQNVGLTEQLGRNIRYTGRMGADVESGLPEVQRRRARKTVLAGIGYQDGRKVSVGASRKGRIWSHRRETVVELVEWCKQVGANLLDERIDPDEVLKGTLDAKSIADRPKVMPICIDWPEDVYRAPEVSWWIGFNGHDWPLSELSVELVEPSPDGALRFAITSETDSVELGLELFEESDGAPNYRFIIHGTPGQVHVRRGDNAQPERVEEFFYQDPPVIWFVDGSSLEGNQHVELKAKQAPYDPGKIQAWNWTGTNLRRESQGPEKDKTSIQARLIRELKNRNYEVIADDDGKGEAADVVAVRLVGDRESPESIEVEFYHCKYSLGDTPGQRIEDLYEVCGQAQKSISWMSSPTRQTDIFTHLLRRDSRRQETGAPSRLEYGNHEQLLTIREISRLRPLRLRINIVQPGLSKANATRHQLELLSVTENHLMETYQLPFGVIASP